MRATVGDRIVVASGVVGAGVREGVVVGCPHGDGTPPYQVRWSDTEEETLVFPGADTLVRHDDGGQGEQASQARAVTWQVQVTLVESQGSTTAEAMLTAGPAGQAAAASAELGTLRAVGHSRKNPDDVEVPLIGDEVAAARALRRLADALLGQAEQDISAQTGHQAHVHT